MTTSNPFCTRRVRPGAISYRFATDGDSARNICDALRTANFGLIIGRHGSGKSTLVQTLLPELQSRYARVALIQLCNPSDNYWINRIRQTRQNQKLVADRIASLDGRDLLVIDGWEQLPACYRFVLLLRYRNRLQNPCSRMPALMATSHRPHCGMTILYECQAQRELVLQLTEDLVDQCDPEVAYLVRSKLAGQDWHRPLNLRDFWFECYDEVQNHQRCFLSHPTAT